MENKLSPTTFSPRVGQGKTQNQKGEGEMNATYINSGYDVKLLLPYFFVAIIIFAIFIYFWINQKG